MFGPSRSQRPGYRLLPQGYSDRGEDICAGRPAQWSSKPLCLYKTGSDIQHALQNYLCFALRSFLISLPSTFQNFFTFTLLPGSSALLQTPECSEYHPSEQSPVVSALSLTRLQLSGTNSLFLSDVLTLSALLNLPWKPFSFGKLIFSLIALIALICDWCVCVCACVRACVRACVCARACVCESVCVRACVHSCCMRWILTVCICKERVSA